MEIRTQGLQLSLCVARPPDPEGWTKLDVEVTVAGFSGRCLGSIQHDDLRRFADALQQMDATLGEPNKAVLSSAEPDIKIELSMDRRGHVVGRYAFESECRYGIPTVLSGAFEMDQSFLPSLRREVAELVVASSSGPSL